MQDCKSQVKKQLAFQKLTSDCKLTINLNKLCSYKYGDYQNKQT